MKPHGLPVASGPAANVVAVVEPAEPGLPALEDPGFRPSDDCGRGDARFESRIAEPQPISGWFLSRISWLDEFPQAGHHRLRQVDPRGIPFCLQDPDGAIRLPGLNPSD